MGTGAAWSFIGEGSARVHIRHRDAAQSMAAEVLLAGAVERLVLRIVANSEDVNARR